jgi:long-subunit fatty acid transport protein
MMMLNTGARIVLSAVALIGMAAAQSLDPDRVSNIERAAAEIAAIQNKSGANGAFAAINDCYKRELAHATALTRGLEVCLAQDIISHRSAPNGRVVTSTVWRI